MQLEVHVHLHVRDNLYALFENLSFLLSLTCVIHYAVVVFLNKFSLRSTLEERIGISTLC